MDNLKQHQARLEAQRLKQEKMAPIAKFSEGQEVLLDRHNCEATVLEVKFNRIPWMHSYTVSPENSDQILEVVEWGIS